MAKYKMTVVFDDKDELLATRGLDELVKNLKNTVLEFIVREVEWHNLAVDRVQLEKLPEWEMLGQRLEASSCAAV